MSIEAMKQALEALWMANTRQWPENKIGAAINALSTAIAEAEKQPTKLFGPGLEELLNRAGFYREEKQEQCKEHGECFGGKCIYTTPPAAKQEPVAYVTGYYDGRCVIKPMNRSMVLPVNMALYTTPPAAQWVGLTEKDFSAINQSCLTKLQAATSAESILKEKNHG